jgi:hypothetical protein
VRSWHRNHDEAGDMYTDDLVTPHPLMSAQLASKSWWSGWHVYRHRDGVLLVGSLWWDHHVLDATYEKQYYFSNSLQHCPSLPGPGLGPISMRKEIVVFKSGFRSRAYCLSECAQVCQSPFLCRGLAIVPYITATWIILLSFLSQPALPATRSLHFSGQ